MVGIYGIITDENIEKYCIDRKIPYFKKEPIERVFSGKRNKCSIFGGDGWVDQRILVNVVRNAFEELKIGNGYNIFLGGSGTYHHVTHGILKNIDISDDFDIISLDHHSDLTELSSGKKIIQCGDHHSFSLRDIEELESVFVISHRHGYYELNYSHNHTWKQRLKCTDQRIKTILKDSENVYLTIDLDVLNYPFGLEEYETHNQGNMDIQFFFEFIDWIFEDKNIIGMDIFGLTPNKASFQIYDKIIEKVTEKIPTNS